MCNCGTSFLKFEFECKIQLSERALTVHSILFLQNGDKILENKFTNIILAFRALSARWVLKV